MDNLTHTLAGLALAEAGLKRTTRLATPTLVLAANLPDLDGLVYLFGNGTDGLTFRRGWTHGVLAMVVLPLLLVGVLRGVRAMLGRNPEGVRTRWLLALAAIGVVSHPLLDLLNVYGVRLLMPFSSRWYYGDALFIVDPWILLALIGGIVLSRGQARRLGATAKGTGLPARTALVLCAGYAVSMVVAARLGAGAVERQAAGDPARRTLAAPGVANPFRREVIRELEGRYELGSLALGRSWRYAPATVLSIGNSEPAARAAAKTPQGAAFLRWARFPRFAIRREDGHFRVTISDVRYDRDGSGGWASVTVRVPGAEASPP